MTRGPGPRRRVAHAGAFTLVEVLAALVVLASLTVAAAAWFRSAAAAGAGAERRLEARLAARGLALALPAEPQSAPRPVPGHADWWWRVVELRAPAVPRQEPAQLGGPPHHWRQVLVCAGRDQRAPILADALVAVADE